ncbi:MAG: hypothetical protein Q8Q09_18615 [Deltaproteobacteria bacterium]|nr:hypothetical protein [Deltaproteobacteria bacterium]
MKLLILVVSALTLLACGAPSNMSAQCSREPRGEACQRCLQDARTSCVNSGVCRDAYNTFESCTVRVAQEGCVDVNGNPATGCCDGPLQTLGSCLDAMCPAWNGC